MNAQQFVDEEEDLDNDSDTISMDIVANGHTGGGARGFFGKFRRNTQVIPADSEILYCLSPFYYVCCIIL